LALREMKARFLFRESFILTHPGGS
jgi:hypothetical protein